MFNKLFISFFIGMFLTFFIACSEDDGDSATPDGTEKEANEDSTKTIDTFEEGDFASFTVEENKQNLGDYGVDLIVEVETMKDAKATEAAYSMVNLMEDSEFDPISSVRKTDAYTVMYNIASVGTGEKSIFELATSLKALHKDDPETLDEMWDDIVGTYSWNATTKAWDEQAGDKIVFEFPSTETGTSNNAVFTIYPYEETSMQEYEDDWSIEVPTSLKCDLVVDGNTEMEFTYDAEFDADGIPTKTESRLFVNPMELAAKAENSSSTVSAEYSFKHDQKILFAFLAEADGNFTKQGVEDASTTVVETDEWGSYEYEEIDPSKVLYSINAKIQLIDVVVSGDMNMTEMIRAEEDADEKAENSDDWDQYEVDMTNAANKYVNLSAYYTDGTKIADSEFYTYEDPEWDNELSSDIRFIFADGSKADAETFFGSGFDELENELNNLINDINAKYDAEIEPVDFD